MRGELLPIWSDMYREVWAKLSKTAPSDLFCELFRELNQARKSPLDVNTLADVIDNPMQARNAFRRVPWSAIDGEQKLVGFAERAFVICQDIGGDALSDRYFHLMEGFLLKYSLRYDLRRPFSLHPTLPGLFSRMVTELRAVSMSDPDLHHLLHDFDEALRDLGQGLTPGRMKTCFIKQFNLLETLASKTPGVTEDTLGKMCGQIQTWPHATVREAAKKIYGFRAYPGLGHGAQGGGALREIECRDLVALSVMMTALTPYLTDKIDSEGVYRGAA